MAAAFLTNLTAVKSWLRLTVTEDDVLLMRLIGQISNVIFNYLQRPNLARTSFTELRNGNNNYRLTLRNWPVVKINSLTVNNLTIPQASGGNQAGYTLASWDGTAAGNPQELLLCGSVFTRGLGNVRIAYDAGYCIANQAVVTSSGSSPTVSITPDNGSWSQDNGVTYADGTPLLAVSGAPSLGQYSVSAGEFGTATYIFNSADGGLQLLFSYSYVPADLEQVALEMIGERYRYKDRIGQVSKSLGGNETAAYSLKGIPDYAAVALEPYKKSIPL